MKWKQQDNSTFRQKVVLRREMLKYVAEPVVFETHGGKGSIFEACYSYLQQGVVIEKDAEKAARLARQRPTWGVYEADCLVAIQAGVGRGLPINILDVDPYGDPWPAIEAWFDSERDWAETFFVAVNDGLRIKVRLGGGWDVKTLQGMVSKYGNNLDSIYLEVCQELMQEKAALAGYSLDRFTGYYCGAGKQMTHYLAILKR